MLEKLNNYQAKLKLTIKFSLTKSLDTGLILNNGIYNFKYYRKTRKQHTHWPSNILKRYKCNIILGDLHRSNRISSNFSGKIKFISQKLIILNILLIM